jgi:two-component system, NtrC family, response regulator AtoC
MVVLADGEQAFAALAAGARSSRPDPPEPACSLVESLAQIARRGAREAERAALEGVLEQVCWNRAEASRILQVSYKTLLNKIAQCQLTPPARGLETP